jgi:hypothetical protein
LLGRILIGFGAGVVFGLLFKDLSLSWIGDLFPRLLKMLIVPPAFFSPLTAFPRSTAWHARTVDSPFSRRPRVCPGATGIILC